MAIKKRIYAMTEKNFIIKKLYYKLHMLKVKYASRLGDEEFAEWHYYDRTKRHLNLENPKTFDEKLWWLKFHYKNPLMTQCVDKYRVREYVESCGLGYILNELYGAYDSSSEINIEELPNEFFIKTNHGCGCNFWCHDKAKFPIKAVFKKLDKNLKENYYMQSREWPYKDVKPKIIVEKVLKPSGKNAPLLDYRFLCFGGKVQYLFVDIDTCDDDGGHKISAKRNVYDRNFRYLNVRVGRENFPRKYVKKPENYEEMIECAEKLAEPFPFVRVDLYNIDGKIVFGELTFYHAGCASIFEPWSFAETMGDLIELPREA